MCMLHDTAWAAWRVSDMRSWLIDHGHLRFIVEKTRYELVKLMQDKYNDVASRTADYLTWLYASTRIPARERQLRRQAPNHPTGPYPGGAHPLHTSHLALWRRAKDIFDSGVEVTENKLGLILNSLTGALRGRRKGRRRVLITRTRSTGRRRPTWSRLLLVYTTSSRNACQIGRAHV